MYKTDRLSGKHSLFLVDDEAVSINEAFNRNPKERVVIDVLAVGSGSRCAQRSASGKGAQCNSGNRDDEKFLRLILS